MKTLVILSAAFVLLTFPANVAYFIKIFVGGDVINYNLLVSLVSCEGTIGLSEI